MLPKKKKNIEEWLILLKHTILLMKSQLVTSYTPKHDVNRCFLNPAWSKCKHVYKPVVSFMEKPGLSVCKYHWYYYYWSIILIWFTSIEIIYSDLGISAYGGGRFVSLFFDRRCSPDYFFRNVNKMAAWIPDDKKR